MRIDKCFIYSLSRKIPTWYFNLLPHCRYAYDRVMKQHIISLGWLLWEFVIYVYTSKS